MDFRDSPEEASFRTELRSWLVDNLPEGWIEGTFVRPRERDERYAFARDWQKRLFEAGWIGLNWPKEYGGREATPYEMAIYLEEMARVRPPETIGVIGLNMAGPTIIVHGTPEQKERHLAQILGADEIWCQGFSEPNAGSDLAGLETRAVLDGDHYVVTGQKVWSSYAHIADWCILVARTDPDAPKHKGLSYFLVDMHSDGVEVRPIVQITGDPEFNEIFFDDVRVPAENLVAVPGEGWQVAMTTLMHERGTLGVALQVSARLILDDLVELARRTPVNGSPAIDDPDVRRKLAWFHVEVEALKRTGYRSLSAYARTGIPGPEGSILKLHWSELNQRMCEYACDLLGPAWQADDRWSYQFLRSRGNTIEAGTSEILRNIIAERVLGLPRGR